MKTIIYSVPLGYFARNLLRTGVPDKLLENKNIQIVILSPAYRDPEFIKEFAFNKRVYFENLLYSREPQNLSYLNVKASLRGSTTQNLFEKILWKLCIIFWSKIKVKGLFLFFMWLNHKFYSVFSRKLYNEIFEKYHPCLLITSTPGYNSQLDIPLIRESKNRGIKTLCLIHSWDNLAGLKGIMPTRPDIVGVWNTLQKEEAVKIHFYEPEKVRVVGATQFNIYQNQSIYLSRDTFFSKMGLGSSKKLVTIATIPSSKVENTFILDILIKMLDENKFSVPVQLLCRLHPLDNRDKYKKYLNNPKIVMDFPGKISKYIGWDPNKEEMIHLANTIKHSDVIVNIASTITIDAAILDIPVVNLSFSSSEPENFQRYIMERTWKYHYRYIKERNATLIAENENDLVNKINRYLLNPSLHRKERSILAQDLCYKLDGKSSERVVNLIFDLINNKR